MPTQDTKRFDLESKLAIGVLFFVVFLIAILIIRTVSNGGSDNTSSQLSPSQQKRAYTPDKMDLYIQAQEFVQRGLKAPATAKFPPLSYETADLGSGRYKIISYVDSQNSFGAMLRSDWSVIMNLSKDQWTLERMVIDGDVVYDPVEAKIKAKKAAQDKAEIDAEIKAVQKQIDDQLQLLKSFEQ